MAIYQDINVVVNQGLALPDKKIYIFEGDRNVILNFKVVNPQYHLTKNDNDILTTRYEVDKLQIRIVSSKGKGTVIEGRVVNGICSVTLSEFFIEQMDVGNYSYQITLIDNDNDAIMTYPVCNVALMKHEPLIISTLIPPAEYYHETMNGEPELVIEELDEALCGEYKSYLEGILGNVGQPVLQEDGTTKYRVAITWTRRKDSWGKGGRIE